MKILCNYSHLTQIGYGQMGTKIDEELIRRGVVTDDEQAGNRLCMMLPLHLDWKYRDQYTVLLSMFETDRLPEAFAEGLRNYDMVLVPCEANRITYAQHHDNVHVVPLGVDPEVWKPVKRGGTRNGEGIPDPFIFLTGGNNATRKGHQEAAQTFKKVRKRLIEKGIRSKLIIKATPEDWQHRASTGLKDLYESEDVVVQGDWMTKKDEVALYAEAHAYISFSKGEGWGLMPNQALAQGLPIILTDAGGQSAFAEYGLVIPHKMEHANYGMWGPCGDWWVPDVDIAADLMVEMATHYALYEARAWVAAHGHPYFWSATVDKILDLIPDRPDIPACTCDPDGVTVGVTCGCGVRQQQRLSLFEVRVVHDLTADIADRKYGFKPGETYWVPADVKRILWEGKHLHPDCVKPGGGLLPEQIPDYKAAVPVCPTCCRPLPVD